MNKKYFPQSRVQILTAAEFIKEYEENPERIERSYIIPPEIGKPGFGKILVEFNSAEPFINPVPVNLNGHKH